MTPEEAHKLREKATPGPWRTTKEVQCGCCMRVEASSALVCIPDIDDAPLVAAAPDLAELVAGMHYEYAAQVGHDGRKKIVTDSDGGLWPCGEINGEMQHWHRDRKDAQDYADCWNSHYSKRTGATARVVRRLVGDPEVVS